MSAAERSIRVGVSGWTYAPWRGIFYPPGLRQSEELRYAAHQFRAVEVNGTFYGSLRPETFADWTQQVDAGFVFAVRAPRTITHVRRLRDVEAPVANFATSGLLRLGMHLGPILWQLPTNLRFDHALIEAFLRLLPRTTTEALGLGRKYDEEPRTPAFADRRRPLRHAIEVRHESFHCPSFIELLKAYNVALVCIDSLARPRLMDVTADFIYWRMHGSGEFRASGYDNDALEIWAERFRTWASGGEPADAERIGPRSPRRRRDVYVIFDNDMKLRAPANAMELVRRLRLSPPRDRGHGLVYPGT